MSMSTRVVGFRPPDDTYERMKAVYESCKAAGIGVPDKVQEFFNWGEPSEHGTEVRLPDGCVSEYADGYRSQQGIDVRLDALPPNITVIRFYNSW